MGVTCSCFGKSQSDHGEGEGLEDGVKKRFLHKVVKKFKLVCHKGQTDSVASNGASRVAAAEPLQSNTTSAPGAIAMRRVAPPTHQNSSHSESQRNKPTTAEAANSVTSQRKRNERKIRRSKPLAKEIIKAKEKHLVASSEEEFKDCVEKLSSSDDEDVCPTCLEEFDEQNPKITSECNHHFHLACIFEWMERSPSCPVCNKAMVFEQMT